MTRARSPVSQDEDEDLYSYFDKSVSAVQAHADQFEKVYARPALETSQAFFDERPVAATFIVIFTLLSFLPVISFIGFSLFAVISFTIIALSCAFLASVTVVLALLSLLVLTLLITLASSAFFTVFGLFLYSLTRLFNLSQEHGRAGIPLWLTEMKNAILYTLLIQHYPPTAEDTELSDSEDVLGEIAVEIKHEDNEDSDGLLAGSSTQEESSRSDEDVKPSI